MSDRSRLGAALLISLLLHVAVVVVSLLRPPERPQFAPEDLLEVALLDAPVPVAPAPAPPPVADEPAEAPAPGAATLPESRIVPMPEAGLELPSEDARFLSDRDNVVAEEMVRRGESLDAAGQDDEPGTSEPATEPEPPAIPAEPPAPPSADPAPADAGPREQLAAASAQAPRAEAERGEVDSSPPGRAVTLADLMPRPGDLAAASQPSDPAERGGEPVRPTNQGRSLLPGRRVRFSSGSGIAAALPSVRDGDVTLLNTKAHEFAPFVRRVATRVFQHLQIQLFDAARNRVSGSGEELALVRATMSPDGRFLHATLVEARSDTRLAVPRMLLNVVGPRTFFDENPPPGATAADGFIHFDLTIQLRVWSEAHPGGRAPLTQFEGYFGTGLR